MMKNVFIKLCCLTLAMLCSLVLFAQTVSNVNAEQVGKTIHITYDLDKAADISVFVSTDGGSTYRMLNQVSGDVGKIVEPGHKTIVWDVQSENGELHGDDIVFKVKVDANAEAQWRRMQRKERMAAIPNNTFVTLNVAYSPMPQWSYGFKVGQVKMAGWFVSVMTNFGFKGMYHPFVEGETYQLTGSSKTARLSVQAGLAVRPWRPMTLLLGVGYGYRTQTFQTAENDWYSYPERTYNGVDASFGLLFDIKGFALSLEAVTTNFQTIEAKVGMGVCLPFNSSKNKTVKVLK